MEKIKKILVVAVLALTLVGIFALHVALPDGDVSDAERRPLAQLPPLTAEGVFSGDYFEDLETYLLDQFPLRDTFRRLKANFQYKVLGLKANNGIYQVGDHLSKLDYPMDDTQIQMAVDKFNAILAAHPQIGKAYYSLIPDKNYFLAEANGYPAMDYAALLQQAEEINAEYIDIFPLLTIDDYYYTDSHWRQEKIENVAQALAHTMTGIVDDVSDYRHESREGFRGVYHGQSALDLPGETMTILRNPVTDSAKVFSLEQNKEIPVYNWADFESTDPYDVFLSGAEALLTIENPLHSNDRHLILFRDSFGSSITPLLLEYYSKITVVDIRYMASGLLDNYVDFTGADVLFLYCTSMFNAGAALK